MAKHRMKERSIICAALRIAAVQYATNAHRQRFDAQSARETHRLRDAFLAQSKAANELADKIEEQS